MYQYVVQVACNLGGTVLAVVLFLRLIRTVIIPDLKTSDHNGVNDEIPSTTWIIIWFLVVMCTCSLTRRIHKPRKMLMSSCPVLYRNDLQWIVSYICSRRIEHACTSLFVNGGLCWCHKLNYSNLISKLSYQSFPQFWAKLVSCEKPASYVLKFASEKGLIFFTQCKSVKAE